MFSILLRFTVRIYFISFLLLHILTIVENEDEVAYWWMNVVAVGCNWLLGEENEAERLFSKVENMPKLLKTTSDPLARAVLAAFVARKSYLMNAHINRKAILHQLDSGSQLIEESLAYSSCGKQNNLVLVSYMIEPVESL